MPFYNTRIIPSGIIRYGNTVTRLGGRLESKFVYGEKLQKRNEKQAICISTYTAPLILNKSCSLYTNNNPNRTKENLLFLKRISKSNSTIHIYTAIIVEQIQSTFKQVYVSCTKMTYF